MLSNIFTLNYPNQLIENMANDLLKKSVVSLVGLSLFILYLFHDYVPLHILLLWIGSLMFFLSFRAYFSYQILHKINTAGKVIKRLLLYNYFVAFFVASTWGMLPWLSFIYVPQYFDLMLAIMTGLILGSMGTLISVFSLLFIFTTTIVLFMLAILIYSHTDNHLLYAIFYTLLYFVFITSSYKYYETLKKSISLQNSLEHLNKFLEKRVHAEVKKNQEQQELLFRQSRMAQMGEMIGNIAHQWRQPLNALNLVIQNIYYLHVDDLLDDKQLKASMDKATRLTNSMSKTIDDFRNFYSDDKESVAFNVAQSILKSIEIIEASYRHNNITIEKDFDETLTIIGQSSELSQVILNILSNAKDALLSNKINKPYVKIITLIQNNALVITIQDNGGGIDDVVMGRIFDPYFSTKAEGEGVGVGLYMSRQIISNMEGTLEAFNHGNGALFKITFKHKELM